MSAHACTICCDDLRVPFQCQFCDKTCCMVCAKRHAMAQAELIRKPRCIFDDCGMEFSDEFVDGAFPQTWCQTELRKTRQEACAVHAMAMLPNKQDLASEFKKESDKAMAAKAHPDVVAALHDPDSIESKIKKMSKEIEHLRKIQRMVALARRSPFQMMRYAKGNVDRNRVQRITVPPPDKSQGPRPEAVRHSLKCPAPGECNGFVVTMVAGEGDCNTGVCGMCRIRVCIKCERPLDAGGDSTHRCTPEDLESMSQIAKDTKPCPHCGVRIYKIDGCSQMWCTSCKGAFDWNTGRPVNSNAPIHNPHYFEEMRRIGPTLIRRPQAGPPVDPCGGPLRYVAVRHVDGSFADDERRLNAVLQHVLHYRGDTAPNARRDFDERQQYREDLAACQFLTKAIDEDKFKSACFLRDRDRMFKEEQARVLDAACDCAIDVLRSVNAAVVNVAAKDVARAFEQLDTLRAHFNESLQKISKRFNDRNTYKVMNTWEIKKEAKRGVVRQGRKRTAAKEADDVLVDDGDV